MQRGNRVLGFGFAVARKYLDDGGGREAALISYYGFLSTFPLLLVGVAVLSQVLVADAELRRELVEAIVPPTLQDDVERSVADLPTSPVALVVGVVGLLVTAAGVVLSADRTLNHLAAVPYRLRFGIVIRGLRAFVVEVVLLAGAVAVGVLTVVTTQPGPPLLWRLLAALGTGLVSFGVLLAAAMLLLARPARFSSLWPAAALGAVAVTVVLDLGVTLVSRVVVRAGLVYGSFATVAGMLALLLLLGRVLVVAAEVAAVRHARLWPRALDPTRPTAADARALELLAREQERAPGHLVEAHLGARVEASVDGAGGSSAVGGGAIIRRA